MATAPAAPEPEIKNKVLGAIVGLVFALIVLGGFAAATAYSYEDDAHHGDDKGEVHEDDHDS